MTEINTSFEDEEYILKSIVVESNIDNLLTCKEHGLEPKHFQKFPILYQTILSLNSNQKPIDLIAILDEWPTGIADDVKNYVFQNFVAHTEPFTENISYRIRRLIWNHNRTNLRKILVDFGPIPDIDSPTNAEKAFDEAKNKLISFSVNTSINEKKIPALSDLAPEFLQELDGAIKGKANRKPIKTGTVKLDQHLGSYLKSNLITICARSGVGKTTTALAIAMNMARGGLKPLFLSEEMPTKELYEKMIYMKINMDPTRFDKLDFRGNELQRIEAAAYELAKLKMKVTSDVDLDIDTIENTVRRLYHRGEVDTVFIDYVQQIRWKGSPKPLERMTEVTGRLSRLRNELDIPIFIIAQLNREADKVNVNTNMKTFIRDSGTIEQDSSIILTVCREEMTESKTLGGSGEPSYRRWLRIDKARRGKEGNISDAILDEYGCILPPDNYFGDLKCQK